MNECIPWNKACFTDGYGARKVKGKQWRAHRYAWTEVYGEIPPGLQVLHRCDNPKCVNVDHLYLGTNSENMRDMIKKGRNKPTRGELDAMAKLTREQVVSIRRLQGSCRIIGKEFGISPIQVSRIKRKETWAWL